MFSLILKTVFITASIGLVTRYVMLWLKTKGEITWYEYGIGMGIITIALAPLTAWIGWKLAISNNVTFNQYLNGYEQNVTWERITCHRDGACRYDYQCDPYHVPVPYDCNCDSKGKNCSTCWRDEIHYHQCPYVTEEWTFTVRTTIGEYDIAEHVFPDHPNQHRWRAYESVPDYVIQQAGTGIPPFWTQAKARLDAGRPGPVTKRGSYPNYILASDLTILKQYSSAIDRLKKQRLLPDISTGVHSYYLAEKVHFIGYQSDQNETWQKTLMYLNEEIGPKLFGDLHLVIVGDQSVNDNPDEYSQALKAYWQNRHIWGENTLMKNAIVVVIGTRDGKTISWTRAFTGMPLGNETMIEDLNAVHSGTLTPEFLLGTLPENLQIDPSKKPFIGVNDSGFIKRTIFGLDRPDAIFHRVSMGGHSPTGGIGPGYLYLKNELRPNLSQENWILFFGILFSSIIWVIAAFLDFDPKRIRNSARMYGYQNFS